MSAFAKPEERLTRIAGAHSGSERAIFDDQGATSATHMHELIHDRIFYETADGLFHLLAFRIAEDTGDRRIRSVSRKLATALFDETRRAHEAAATYMGLLYSQIDLISLRPSEARGDGGSPLGLAELPDEYQQYYQLLGDVLDDSLCSAWLRLAIAWPITHWAFSSLRLSRATGELARGRADVADLPGPDSRLTAGLQAIENFGTPKWIEEILRRAMALCAERGVAWQNIDDDREWPDTAGAQKSETTQQCIFQTVRAWLDGRVARGYWPSEVDPEVRDILSEHDIVFGERPDAIPYRINDTVIDARAQLRIAERARVLRHAEPRPDAFAVQEVEEFATSGGSEPMTLTLLVNSRWGARKFRTALTRGSAEALPGVELNARQLEWLMRWWARRSSAVGSSGPPFVVCEFTFEADGLTRMSSPLKRAGFTPLKCSTTLEGDRPSSVIPINYIEQGMSGILEHVPGTVYNIDVQSDHAGSRVGVILFLPDASDLHACMKIVPRFDLGGYIAFERSIRDTRALMVGEKLPEAFGSRFGFVIRAVLDCWHPL